MRPLWPRFSRSCRKKAVDNFNAGAGGISMRIVQLDLIRCLAVLLVLGRHMTPCPRETSYLMWALTSVWGRGGWIGVDLFFVLSGFLVSGLLFREYKSREAVNATHFLIRRGFKIYP